MKNQDGSKDEVIKIRAKIVIIANGGIQGLPGEIFNWYPSLTP
jgi:hypothetical protein